MTEIIEVKTNRLILRQWRKTDFDMFAQMNSSNTVMQFYPDIMTKKQSDEFAQRNLNNIAINGWGFWAIEIPTVSNFIGFVGLNQPSYELPFSNNQSVIEIGWRLSENYWGRGYATEAAQAALDIGFKQLQFTEIISFASLLNQPSIRVMEKIKMQNTNNDFMHPKIPDGHQLQRHCLYSITKENWLEN